MSWAIGFDSNWQRDIGYGVPAFCDHPRCNKKIDRGLSYVCGSDPYGGEHGCGLYFCESHLFFNFEDGVFVCSRCLDNKRPYKPKPDHPEWTEFKNNDPSWQKWREAQKG